MAQRRQDVANGCASAKETKSVTNQSNGLKRGHHTQAVKRYDNNIEGQFGGDVSTFPGHCSRCGWGCKRGDKHPCRYNENGNQNEFGERNIDQQNCLASMWREGPSPFTPTPPPPFVDDTTSQPSNAGAASSNGHSSSSSSSSSSSASSSSSFAGVDLVSDDDQDTSTETSVGNPVAVRSKKRSLGEVDGCDDVDVGDSSSGSSSSSSSSSSTIVPPSSSEVVDLTDDAMDDSNDDAECCHGPKKPRKS